MFKTLTISPRGETTECLVYRLETSKRGPTDDKLGIIYPEKIMFETHVVRNPDNGEDEIARLVVIITIGPGEQCTVDPFDFHWSSGMFYVWLPWHWHRHLLNLTWTCFAHRKEL